MDCAVREKRCREKACRVEMPDCQVMTVETEEDDFRGPTLLGIAYIHELNQEDYYISSAEKQTGIKNGGIY